MGCGRLSRMVSMVRLSCQDLRDHGMVWMQATRYNIAVLGIVVQMC